MQADLEWDSLTPEDLAARFQALNGELTNELEAAGEDIGEKGAEEYRRRVSKDLGNLEESIDHRVEVSGSTLTVWFGTDDTPKAAALEFGTNPFTPPISPLRDWAARQLGSAEAAWGVQEKISREGLEEREWLKDAFEETAPFAQQRLEEVPGNARARVDLA